MITCFNSIDSRRQSDGVAVHRVTMASVMSVCLTVYLSSSIVISLPGPCKPVFIFLYICPAVCLPSWFQQFTISLALAKGLGAVEEFAPFQRAAAISADHRAMVHHGEYC